MLCQVLLLDVILRISSCLVHLETILSHPCDCTCRLNVLVHLNVPKEGDLVHPLDSQVHIDAREQRLQILQPPPPLNLSLYHLIHAPPLEQQNLHQTVPTASSCPSLNQLFLRWPLKLGPSLHHPFLPQPSFSHREEHRYESNPFHTFRLPAVIVILLLIFFVCSHSTFICWCGVCFGASVFL